MNRLFRGGGHHHFLAGTLFIILFFVELSGLSTVVVRTRTTTSTEVAVPRYVHPLTTGIVVLRNHSSDKTAVVSLASPRTPDLSNFEKILAAVRRRTPDESTVSLARAACDLVWEFRQYNWVQAEPSYETYDPVKLFNIYGYGLCDTAARALATILHGLGIPSRVWDLRVHVVTEFFDGMHWQSLDPDMRVHAYVAGTTRTLPARLIPRYRSQLPPAEVPNPEAAIVLRQQLVQALERVTSPPQLAWWRPWAQHDARIRLRPGEQVIRFSNSQLGYYATKSQNSPPLYGNTLFYWERVLPPDPPTEDDLDDARIRSTFPFVIVDGIVTVTSLQPGQPPAEITVSKDGTSYEPAILLGQQVRDFEIVATYLLPETVRGSYSVIIKLCGHDSLLCDNVPQVRYEQLIITQSSPTTFPSIDAGEGEDMVQVELDDEADLDVTVLYKTSEDSPNDFSLLTEP